MAEKKDRQSLSARNGSVVVGGNVQGSAIVVGDNNVVNNQSVNVAPLFQEILREVERRPDLKPAEKEDIQAELQDLRAELEKPQPDEGFLARRLRNIKRMSPEIVDVALKTLQNPVGGVAEVIRRVAKKMAEEAA